jgi:hypothetical protein
VNDSHARRPFHDRRDIPQSSAREDVDEMTASRQRQSEL